MSVAYVAALASALSILLGCREEARAPFSPRFLPHDGGFDASEFEPPQTGASTNSGSSVGSGAPRVSEDGCIGSFSDNFNDGINPDVWTPDPGCNGTVSAANDAVKMTKRTGGNCSSVQAYLSLERGTFLCGDFDVSVDYRIPDWIPSAPGERWVTLRAIIESDLVQSGIALERLGGYVEGDDCREGESVYIAGAGSASACSAKEHGSFRITTAVSGKLRIERKGAKVAAYLRGGTGWTKLLEANGSTERMILSVIIGTNLSEHTVFFDNVTVTSQR
jgi:hypothetical protein